MPLADRIRPATLNDVVGQSHLIGKNRPLTKIIESGRIPNMIFYGPSGVGKTTVARIIADSANMRLHKLNGTNASTADIKSVVSEVDTFLGCNGILLYLDEIQYLNKKQQQSLLEYIEDGSITLIASTTENPYFYVYNAILSRSTVFEFKPVQPAELEKAIRRGFSLMTEETGVEYHLDDDAVRYISRGCGGDVRKSLNTVELCALTCTDGEITLELAQELTQRSNMRYDRDGDQHYDLLSALQKSIRGSDENAALHYAARLIEAGDIISLSRRLLVIASEDIGLAYPQAVSVVKACVDSANMLGLPEARLPLAQAAIFLATAPKSNSAILAMEGALADLRAVDGGEVPTNLRDAHYGGAAKLGHGQGYRYAHDYPHHYVKQQYLPDALKDRVYYQYGENKTEQTAKRYWDLIKGEG